MDFCSFFSEKMTISENASLVDARNNWVEEISLKNKKRDTQKTIQ
jgi:hypothetical protein